jgi:1,2-dihydroxy-3-keto-5-methylthiopentene dioxygenase
LGGYKSDIICLFPTFEHLDFIMDKFGDVHYHFENEYWHIFDGRLGFVFYSPRGFKFRMIVEAGEYIQVPEGIWQQCFFAAKEDRVKSMRFFNTTGKVVMPTISF